MLELRSEYAIRTADIADVELQADAMTPQIVFYRAAKLEEVKDISRLMGLVSGKIKG